MKKYKFVIFCLIITSSWIFAQVAVGKTTITNISGTEVAASLEFYDGNDNARGIILPWVSTVAGTPDASYTGINAPVDGTLIFDVSDEKIKYRKTGSWSDLTVKSKSDVVPGITNTNLTADLAIQNFNLTDKASAKVAIGTNAETDTTNGILVLTDTNKAMVLPKVNNPQTTIQNPSAGMIVYDTNKRLLCVFNGTVWTFWKP